MNNNIYYMNAHTGTVQTYSECVANTHVWKPAGWPGDIYGDIPEPAEVVADDIESGDLLKVKKDENGNWVKA